MREESENITITDEAVAAISVSALLQPGQHFNHPQDVLAAQHIDKDEKRAILASWASDQFTMESMPILRYYPGTERAVSYDEILGALRALDEYRPKPYDPAATSWKPNGSRPQEPQPGTATKLNIGKFWKGGRPPRIADA